LGSDWLGKLGRITKRNSKKKHGGLISYDAIMYPDISIYLYEDEIEKIDKETFFFDVI